MVGLADFDCASETLYLGMIMKAKHAIIIFICGYCFDFIGALLKIMHQPKADTVLIIATILKVSGAILFLYKITNYPRIKEFLDS
jgi:hypothetical protein